MKTGARGGLALLTVAVAAVAAWFVLRGGGATVGDLSDSDSASSPTTPHGAALSTAVVAAAA